ncbi:MAG: hypothetical protein ABR599_00015 [Gemmatimonadota bacterium]
MKPEAQDAPPAEFARECRAFFARRLQGPAEARAAVLAALAEGEPYALAWAVRRAGSRARRLGLVAEVVRAALRTGAAALDGPPPEPRLERARRVLAADTLLTFAYELAADLGGEEGEAARRLLGAALGAEQLEDPAGGLDERCDAVAAEFLRAALGEEPRSS